MEQLQSLGKPFFEPMKGCYATAIYTGLPSVCSGAAALCNIPLLTWSWAHCASMLGTNCHFASGLQKRNPPPSPLSLSTHERLYMRLSSLWWSDLGVARAGPFLCRPLQPWDSFLKETYGTSTSSGIRLRPSHSVKHCSLQLQGGLVLSVLVSIYMIDFLSVSYLPVLKACWFTWSGVYQYLSLQLDLLQ